MSSNKTTLFPIQLPFQPAEKSSDNEDGNMATPPKPVPPPHTVFTAFESLGSKDTTSGPSQTVSNTPPTTSNVDSGIKTNGDTVDAVKNDTNPPQPKNDVGLPGPSMDGSMPFDNQEEEEEEEEVKEVPINIIKKKTKVATFDFFEFDPNANTTGGQEGKMDGIFQFLLKQSQLGNESARDRYNFELELRKLQLQKEREEREAKDADRKRKYELEKLRLEIELETIRTTKKTLLEHAHAHAQSGSLAARVTKKFRE
ncbi:hypothetical protein TWF481_008694 [Arthrobotrys musiformis]|uniref:Uncharacterized protein n=1 Tax=Arthrobotrys musiformis TaxID=47236 RepID=A0AAV9W8X2_9PEZI